VMGPFGCVVAVTYRCNSRCTMCDIWKLNPAPGSELGPEAYRWLPSSLRTINVSGGEPFLRDDLPDVVRVMRETCPRARIVVSTNGLRPRRITETVAELGDVAIRISVDAVGEKHDEMRGTRGAFDRAMETVRRLQELGVSDIGLGATSTEMNVGDVTEVRELARERGIRFVATAAHSSPIFFGSHDEERPHSEGAVREVASLMRERLASRNPVDWAKAYYMRGLIDYIQRKPRRLPCRAGIDFFFLDPEGNVYPCNISGTKMGNIREGTFTELQSRSAGEVRPTVADCREQCWMVCTVVPPMRRRPLKPVVWIAGAKLLGLDTHIGE